MKTKMLKHTEANHTWCLVDVEGKILGRAATKIAQLLSGKNRPDYTPNVDAGCGVIVLNCGKIKVTGRKEDQKTYKRFSGYPGGQTVTGYKTMKEQNPKYIVKHAVRGMLPKNKLGNLMIKRLKLYEGTEHPHAAQQPAEVKI